MEQAEVKDQANYEDDYVEDNYEDDYKRNTKKDAGSTRYKIKKIPVWKITIDTPVPDEPQEKHDPPNDKQYQKELDAINDSIIKHQKNIDDLNTKIQNEKTGNNPEFKSLIAEQKELSNEIKELDKVIKDIEAQIGEPAQREKVLKEQRTNLEKELDIKDLDKLNATILGLQNDLGFSQLSAAEEKKKMILKEKLEAQVIKTKKYQNVRDELKKIQATNKPMFDKLKASRKERGEKIGKRKDNNTKIDALAKTNLENATVINQLIEQIKSIRGEIKKLNNEWYEKNKEWENKHYKYDQYKEVMDYIAEFKKIQHDLKKKEEKQKKREEKEAKKNQKVESVEINIVKSEDTVEIVTCQELIDFFHTFVPKVADQTNAPKEEKSAVSDKIAEDLKKGNLQIFDRNALNDQQVVSVSGGAKKKEKGPKISKREQKANSTDILLLSVGINSKIKELKLTAPNKRDQVESFIKVLQNRLVELKEEAQRVRNEPKQTEAAVQETKQN